VVLGAGLALVMIPARAFVQGRSPDEIRGRVISTQRFLTNSASTLPLPVIGILADSLGFGRVFALLALLALTAGGLCLRRAGSSGSTGAW
jgi:hypothetical protein